MKQSELMMKHSDLMKKTKKVLIKHIYDLAEQVAEVKKISCEQSIEKIAISDCLKSSKGREVRLRLDAKNLTEQISCLDWAKDAVDDIKIKGEELINATKGHKVEVISHGYQFDPAQTRTTLCPKITSENALIELVGFIEGITRRPVVQDTQSVIDGCDR